MESLILIIHILLAVCLVGIILLQKSESSGALGIGSGGSANMGNIFTMRGAANLLTRITAFLALGFFATSILLAVIHSRGVEKEKSVILDDSTTNSTPVAPISGQNTQPMTPNVPSAVPLAKDPVVPITK